MLLQSGRIMSAEISTSTLLSDVSTEKLSFHFVLSSNALISLPAFVFIFSVSIL